MRLCYFTEDAYNRLYDSIEDNVERYLHDEDWLFEYFGNDEYYKKSSVEVNEFKPKLIEGKKTKKKLTENDLENTKRLYEAFKNLSPWQATNPYFWAYLCHRPEYAEYIRNRWLQKKDKDVIEKRYFVKDGKTLLRYNALSRLWWSGYLTYDIGNEGNPYWLTEILFTNQTIHADVLDTLNRTNPVRMKGVLLAIRDFIEENGNSRNVAQYARESNKYLNRYAGVTNMEFLDSEEIRNLSFDKMMRLKAEDWLRKERARKKQEKALRKQRG